MAAPNTQQPCLRHGAPALLLLLPALATALACHHLRPHHATFPWDSLQLLQTMAPSPTQPCHHPQAPFFPDTLRHTGHPHQAAATTLRILQHLFDIFSSTSTPDHWDAQARHQLLSLLQHHIHHMEKCLLAHSMLLKRQGPRSLVLSINKYFRDIQDFLRTHNHSACAWDHVCLQARLCFQHVDTLMRQMKSQDAPALHQTLTHQMPIPRKHQQPQVEQRP